MQGILKPPLDPFSELTLAGQLGFPGAAAAQTAAIAAAPAAAVAGLVVLRVHADVCAFGVDRDE